MIRVSPSKLPFHAGCHQERRRASWAAPQPCTLARHPSIPAMRRHPTHKGQGSTQRGLDKLGVGFRVQTSQDRGLTGMQMGAATLGNCRPRSGLSVSGLGNGMASNRDSRSTSNARPYASVPRFLNTTLPKRFVAVSAPYDLSGERGPSLWPVSSSTSASGDKMSDMVLLQKHARPGWRGYLEGKRTG